MKKKQVDQLNEDLIFTSDITVVLSGGKSLGKYTNGQVIPAIGKSAKEVFLDIAVEYLLPAFNAFAITGQATTIEVGTTIAAGNKTFTWGTTNSGNVQPNSLVIRDMTAAVDLATGLANDGSEVINLGAVTLSSGGATRQYRITGTNTQAGTFQLTFTITAQYRQFYGPVASAPANSADVRALPSNRFDTAGNTFDLNTGTVERIFAVAMRSGKTITSVIDVTALNANITSQYILNTFNVDDAGGTPTAYNIYVYQQAIPYSENHIHRITTN